MNTAVFLTLIIITAGGKVLQVEHPNQYSEPKDCIEAGTQWMNRGSTESKVGFSCNQLFVKSRKQPTSGDVDL